MCRHACSLKDFQPSDKSGHFLAKPLWCVRMAGKQHEPQPALQLPDVVGRVGVLGGTQQAKTQLCVGLALRQVQQRGLVLCLDARRYKQTEIQFRLLLRENARYIPLPPSGLLPKQIPHEVLKIVSQGLQAQQIHQAQQTHAAAAPPPLLLVDNVNAGAAWERTLSFVLKAGATVVSFLGSAAEVAFGRYDTLLVLPAQTDRADEISRTVGRKVSPEDIMHLPSGEGWLIHLSTVYRVQLLGTG
jgi:hypothetical protein